MVTQLAIALSFIAFLLLFTGVGLYASTRKQATTADYLLASRDVNPWLVGLSAFSTAHSGGMFIAMVGWTYVEGVSTLWYLFGWFLGDYITWFFIHKRLRVVSEETESETIGGFLAHGQKDRRWIAGTSALITILFLGAYAAAQLLGGSKALYVIFNVDYTWGIFIGAAIVVSYCFAGGIRASIWTDALQSILMMFAMGMLLVLALFKCGGFDGLWTQLAAIDPQLVHWRPLNLQYGFGLFLLSWLAAGAGVVGQPHIMVRAMVVDSAEHIGLTRNIYAFSYVVFSTATILVGLTSRVLLPNLANGGGDPELAFPQLAIQLFPELPIGQILPSLLIGVILAGIFAAVISTADSQILSCSAALTQDLFPGMARSYRLVKAGTLIVTAIIVAIALSSDKNMLTLGLFAWSALGAGLGPILMLRVWRLPISAPVGVTMMIVGVSIAAVWKWELALSAAMYEVFPGMVAGFFVYGLVWLYNRFRLQPSA